jgi:hypothetical protein
MLHIGRDLTFCVLKLDMSCISLQEPHVFSVVIIFLVKSFPYILASSSLLSLTVADLDG